MSVLGAIQGNMPTVYNSSPLLSSQEKQASRNDKQSRKRKRSSRRDGGNVRQEERTDESSEAKTRREVPPMPYINETSIDRSVMRYYENLARNSFVETAIEIITYVTIGHDFTVLGGGDMELPLLDHDMKQRLRLQFERAIMWKEIHGFVPFNVQRGGIQRDPGRGYFEEQAEKETSEGPSRKRTRRDEIVPSSTRSDTTATIISSEAYSVQASLQRTADEEPDDEPLSMEEFLRREKDAANDDNTAFERSDLEFTIPPLDMGEFTTAYDTRDDRHKVFFYPDWESDYGHKNGRSVSVANLSEEQKEWRATHIDRGNWFVYVDSEPVLDLGNDLDSNIDPTNVRDRGLAAGSTRIPRSRVGRIVNSYIEYMWAVRAENFANQLSTQYIPIEEQRPPVKGELSEEQRYNTSGFGLAHGANDVFIDKNGHPRFSVPSTNRRAAYDTNVQQQFERNAYRVPEGFVYKGNIKPTVLIKSEDKHKEFISTVAMTFGIPKHMLVISEQRYKDNIVDDADRLLIGGVSRRGFLQEFFHTVMSIKNGEKYARVADERSERSARWLRTRRKMIENMEKLIKDAEEEIMDEKKAIKRLNLDVPQLPEDPTLAVKNKAVAPRASKPQKSTDAEATSKPKTAPVEEPEKPVVALTDKVRLLNARREQLRVAMNDISIATEKLATLMNSGRLLTLKWFEPVVTHTSNIPNIKDESLLTVAQQRLLHRRHFGIDD